MKELNFRIDSEEGRPRNHHQNLIFGGAAKTP
jgi:hypothetical protein